VLTPVAGKHSSPQTPNYLYSFLKHFQTVSGNRPFVPMNMLVQVLTGANPKEKAPGHHSR
jgi:hypothetical protein